MKDESVYEYVQRMYEHIVINEEGEGIGNTTANVDGYNTPNAFDGEDEDEHAKNVEALATQFGYTYPESKKKRNTVQLESDYKKIASAMYLDEGSYKDFSKDPTPTKQKMNVRIKDIHRAIYEAERLVDHALRLKSENKVTQDDYWKRSKVGLNKIAERVNRLTKKVIELGA